jgi:hypothetical protein
VTPANNRMDSNPEIQEATVYMFSAIRRIALLGKPLGGIILRETAVHTVLHLFALSVELCHN